MRSLYKVGDVLIATQDGATIPEGSEITIIKVFLDDSGYSYQMKIDNGHTTTTSENMLVRIVQ